LVNSIDTILPTDLSPSGQTISTFLSFSQLSAAAISMQGDSTAEAL